MFAFDVKKFGKPDETRAFADKGRMEILKFGDLTIGKGIFDPGWRWSEHVKPIAGTETCEATHTGYCLTGRLRIRMDDGREKEIGPGDTFYIPPGHDAWVVGNEPCTMIDFTGAENYAARQAARPSAERAQPQPSVH